MTLSNFFFFFFFFFPQELQRQPSTIEYDIVAQYRDIPPARPSRESGTPQLRGRKTYLPTIAEDLQDFKADVCNAANLEVRNGEGKVG